MPTEKISAEEYRRRIAAGVLDSPEMRLNPPSKGHAQFSTGTRVPEPKNKYRNKPTTVDGINFQSGDEAKRYLVLKDAERAGKIVRLALQPRFTVMGPFRAYGRAQRKTETVMDFKYEVPWIMGGPGHVVIVEDVKGKDNALSRLKRKIFLREFRDCIGYFQLVKNATDPIVIAADELYVRFDNGTERRIHSADKNA